VALLLGIDAGTTSLKAGIFTPDGTCLGIGREEYTLRTPQPEWAELEAETYWGGCVRSVRQALAASGVDPAGVVALAVSSQGETTIPVNAQGRALRPAIVWLDNRAGREAGQLAAQFGSRAYRMTGIPDIAPTWTACKLAWLREHEPKVFAAAYKFLLVQDYLVHHLCGEFVTEGAVACTTLLYDIVRHDWWEEVLAAVGVEPRRLASIARPGAAVGKLTASAAETLGLPPGVLVVLGGMDQAVGAIGAGNVAPGMVSESTGAALAVQVTIASPDVDQSARTPVYVHSVPGRYLFVPVCPTAGMALKWFRDVFGQEEIASARQANMDSYDLLTALAAQIAPGSDGLVMLPHLMGAYSPEYNMSARGVFSGFTLGHRKGHFVRAILEAVAFILRRNLDLVAQAGVPVKEVRSGGGGARSLLWNQIKADVCGVPVVTLANEETALLGDAILAGVASGVFSSIEEGSQSMVAVGGRMEPGPQQAAYARAYRRYCDLNDSLDTHFRNSYG
jgi:sugar (pentulose or hexulose) kinase